MRFKSKVPILILVVLTYTKCWAGYNRSSAVSYANSWWQTDTHKFDENGNLVEGQDEYCDKVNTPTYTWYYWIEGKEELGTASNDGDNTILSEWGADCANFVSQCLKAGGIGMQGDGGKGGTYYRVGGLEYFLSKISEVTVINRTSYAPPYYDQSKVPSNITIGDVIIFEGRHSSIVIADSGANVRLAAHSIDRNYGTIDFYFSLPLDWNQTIIYHIDTEPATVEITAPTNGAILNQALVTISGTAADDKALDKVEIFLTNSQDLMAAVVLTGTLANWSKEFPLVDGTWTAKVTAYDTVGSSTTKQISFTIDTTPPQRVNDETGTPKEPTVTPQPIKEADGWINTNTVTVSWVDCFTGADSYLVSIDGGEWFETTELSKVFSNLTDGVHTIRIKAKDKAGNESEVIIVVVKIDTTPPEIEPFPTPNTVVGTSSEFEFITTGCCPTESTAKIPTRISFGAGVSDNLSGVDEGSVTGSGPGSQPTSITWSGCGGPSGGVSFDNPTEEMKYKNGVIQGAAFLHGKQSYSVMVYGRDKAGNENSKTWSFNVGLSKTRETKPAPACDKPDEFEGVVNELVGSTTTQIQVNSEVDPIGIMTGGLLVPSIRLLADISERFELVDYVSNLNEILPRIKVLIIPSGGLYGLGDVESFKRNLADYVNNGGTIVCFTQQHGYEFGALPITDYRLPITGYGWNEDQSCQSASVYINEVSPVFNGQTRVNLDVNVDGYFTQWSTDTKVLLRRTKNNMPCLIEYTVKGREVEGRQVEGRVIATTLYSDFSYAQGSLSQEEKTLIKSLIDYAVNPSTPATQSLQLSKPIEGSSFSENQQDELTTNVNTNFPEDGIISDKPRQVDVFYKDGKKEKWKFLMTADNKLDKIKIQSADGKEEYLTFKDIQKKISGGVR
ncbi:MAG: amidase domain-containing protein [Elusimicrobiota bacterium]